MLMLGDWVSCFPSAIPPPRPRPPPREGTRKYYFSLSQNLMFPFSEVTSMFSWRINENPDALGKEKKQAILQKKSVLVM